MFYSIHFFVIKVNPLERISTGTDAIIQISEGPVKTVYVKRLIRQDQSGIWTVVGYDPR